MKKLLLVFVAMLMLVMTSNAQTKKDGTPDMRYKENKKTYSTPSYSAPKKEKNYSNGGQYKVQKGYQKKSGKYVSPHIKTTPDNKKYNNYKKK